MAPAIYTWNPDRPSVTLGRAGEGTITFAKAVWASAADVRIPILIESLGLTAEASIELEGWGGWTVRFLEYFADLASAWRGWADSKEWSDDQRIVSLSATHDGVGTITMQVTVDLIPGQRPQPWRLVVIILLDPGSLDRVLARPRHLVEQDPTPPLA